MIEMPATKPTAERNTKFDVVLKQYLDITRRPMENMVHSNENYADRSSERLKDVLR